MTITTESQFRDECVAEILMYYEDVLNKHINTDDVYVVWQVKALENFKALLSTNIPDTRYFEITYNGDKGEMYFDAYVKEMNLCIKE